MVAHLARNHPQGSFPRMHYNSRRKSKKQFETIDEAQRYIEVKHLNGYKIYKCGICSKYHITHKDKNKGE